MNKKFDAIVVNTKDPENKGRAQVKITEVHDINTSNEECFWATIRNPNISSGGIGNKMCVQTNQWVTVEDVSGGACAAFEITGGSSIVDAEHQEQNEYSYNKDVVDPPNEATGGTEDNKPFNWNVSKNKALSKSPFPKIFSADDTQLKNTLDFLINSNLLKVVIGGEGPEDPVPPVTGYPIITNEVDFTKDSKFYVNRLGKDLGLFNDNFWFDKDGFNAPITQSNAILELLPGTSGHPGDIIGYEENGEESYVKLEGWRLIIPPNVENDPNGKLYTIEYKVTDLSNLTNTSSNVIKILVFDEIPENRKKDISINSTQAVTKQLNIQEPSSDSNKGNPEDKQGIQLPNGISLELDGSSDNAYYAIKHPAGCRYEIFHDGDVINKSKKDMFMISENKTFVWSEKQLDLGTTEVFNVKAREVHNECKKFVIDGDLYVTGNIICDGTITAKDFIVSDTGVKLKTHKHTETDSVTLGPQN